MRPTPSPAKKRPTMNVVCSVLAVCKMTPRLNGIRAERMSPHLRPTQSAKYPAERAPTKVPIDRTETINDMRPASWAGVISNCFCQNGIVWIPEIVPVRGISVCRKPSPRITLTSIVPEQYATKGREDTYANRWPYGSRLTFTLFNERHREQAFAIRYRETVR